MRDDPLTEFYLALTGQTGDLMSLGGMRWVMELIYWSLLLSGIWIAIVNWRRFPEQRTGYHLSVFGLRYVLAGMWFLGTLWKLPMPVAAGFQYYMQNSVKYSAYAWHSSMMQFFLDRISITQPLVFLLEIAFTVSLTLGFAVRLSGILAALFTLNIMLALYNDPHEWPWTYMGIAFAHFMFAAVRAGRSLGVDNLLAHEARPTVLTGNTVLGRTYAAVS